MVSCKNCGGSNVVRNGVVLKRQRYKCKSCGSNFREGDDRVIHNIEKKMKVLKSYFEGVGIRSIERLEGVSAPLVITWIRKITKIVREKLNSIKIEDDGKNIEILELDELFTYCKKNSAKYTYGLLLIGTEIRLLTLK